MNDNNQYPEGDFEKSMKLLAAACVGHGLHPLAVAEASAFMASSMLLASQQSGVTYDMLANAMDGERT